MAKLVVPGKSPRVVPKESSGVGKKSFLERGSVMCSTPPVQKGQRAHLFPAFRGVREGTSRKPLNKFAVVPAVSRQLGSSGDQMWIPEKELPQGPQQEGHPQGTVTPTRGAHGPRSWALKASRRGGSSCQEGTHCSQRPRQGIWEATGKDATLDAALSRGCHPLPGLLPSPLPSTPAPEGPQQQF